MIRRVLSIGLLVLLSFRDLGNAQEKNSSR